MTEGAKESTVQAVEEVAVTKNLSKDTVSIYDIYWLGITIVIGGQLISWNAALAQGFSQTFIASILVMGTGYLTLIFCIAEMTSILPFAGGSYGFTRAILGPATGYFVAISESLEYIVYVASAASSFGDLCGHLFGYTDDIAYPLYFVLLYFITVPFHIYGGQTFWIVSTTLGALALFFVALYCLANISHADITNKSEYHPIDFTDGKSFMKYLNVTAWFYIGVEAMTLGNNNIKDAANKVPFAMVGCIGTLLVTATCILLCAGSIAPGTEILTESFFPFFFGYSDSLNMSKRVSSLVMLPGIIGTAYGFQFAYTRQLYAMSCSGLVPKFVSATWGPNNSPSMAALVASFLSLALLLGCYRTFQNYGTQLFDIVMCGACCVYISLFRSYIICHSRYSNMERSFCSPLGVFGAYLGMAIFSLVLIGIAFFNEDNGTSISAFVIIMIVAMAYYLLVAQKREFFSKEEQDKFMRAYILNANHKNKKSRSRSRAASSSSASGIIKGLNKVLPSNLQLRAGKSMVAASSNLQNKSMSQASQLANSDRIGNHSSTGHVPQKQNNE